MNTALTSVEPDSLFRIKAIHITEKLKLKDLREKFGREPLEFSNYEMVIRYGENSYLFIYKYGSAVFFNVPEEAQEKALGAIHEYRASTEQSRATDVFYIQRQEAGSLSAVGGGSSHSLNRVFFDRVLVTEVTYPIVKIVCMLLAESTALEYYENLIENLLEKTNAFSKRLLMKGKILQSSEELIKFIGMCLDTKQEIISNLYIVDSPDETWENVELDKLHQELKLMMDVDLRYRALDYKIKIIQESVEVIVDLSKSKRETLLEMTIILLISFEIILSIITMILKKVY